MKNGGQSRRIPKGRSLEEFGEAQILLKSEDVDARRVGIGLASGPAIDLTFCKFRIRMRDVKAEKTVSKNGMPRHVWESHFGRFGHIAGKH